MGGTDERQGHHTPGPNGRGDEVVETDDHFLIVSDFVVGYGSRGLRLGFLTTPVHEGVVRLRCVLQNLETQEDGGTTCFIPVSETSVRRTQV